MYTPPRRAKIVATLGPSSSDEITIENLIRAGVNVFRLNFSHGTHEDHTKRFRIIRATSEKLQRPIAILQDLQGPKLRVGKFLEGSITLDKGENIELFYEERNAKKKAEKTKKSALKQVPYNHKTLAHEVKPGHRILLDDGNLELVVTGSEGEIISAQVVFGGVLKDHKGMNFPDTRLKVDAFTEKDREDLLLGMKLGVDYVALSFVRTATDVRNIQKFMHAHKKNIPVVSKIEKAEAIVNLPDILEVTDAVMVARGDLAVEVGTAQVPSLQKQIIRECKTRGIPVITATQMLESMISSPRPTRAEASDVANAVLDGSDALMLSAESASGKFPILAVSTMHNIILETESRKDSTTAIEIPAKPMTLLRNPNQVNPEALAALRGDAIEHAAAQISSWLDIRAIVCITHTGRSARYLAKYRPRVQVFAMTDSVIVQRQLCLVWGIESTVIKESEDLEKISDQVEDQLIHRKIVSYGDQIIFTAGWPPLRHGTTNLLKILTIRKRPEALTKVGKKTGANPQHENVQGYRTRQAQFILDQNLCIQCGGCVEVCPNDIFGTDGKKVFLKEPNCKNCTFDDACIQICPTGAVEVIKF